MGGAKEEVPKSNPGRARGVFLRGSCPSGRGLGSSDRGFSPRSRTEEEENLRLPLLDLESF